MIGYIVMFVLGLLFGVIVAALCSAGRIAPMTVALAQFAYPKNWHRIGAALTWVGGGNPVGIAREALR